MKRTIPTTSPGIRQSAAFSLLLLLMSAAAFRAEALPVVSEINIVAGTRGVAVSLSADAPFTAEFSGDGKSAVARLTGCVYGLTEFSYSDFPVTSPVRCITAREKTPGSIDISITLKQAVTVPVKAVQKKNQWMALLCETPVEPYTWNTALATPLPKPPVQESAAAPQSSGPHIGNLRNVRLLQRGQVCELAFEFDTEVASSIQKKGTSVFFTAENIKNDIGTKVLDLPANSVFKKVSFAETVSKNITQLHATVTIDTAQAESNFNVAFTRGTVLSLFIVQRRQQKATLWTSGHGLAWNYQFYDVPSYNIDMETMGSKARRDAAQQLSREKTFAVKEAPPAVTEPSEPQPPQTVQAPEPPPAETVAVPAAPPEDTTATMVVSAASVNIRGTPSIEAAVLGKLKKGDTAYIVGTSDKWYKIHAIGLSGFVYSTFVRSVDMAVAPPSTVASRTPPEMPEPQPSITPVSTAVSDDIYMSAQSTPAEVHPDRSVDSTVKLKKGIRYNGGGRDPFEPIIPSSVSLSGLPFAENLSLVGVLYDDVDRIALCEDARNDSRPFALREHDPVEKGKVLKIYQDKVVFLITEFGISRSFTLQLSKITDEQEASKK